MSTRNSTDWERSLTNSRRPVAVFEGPTTLAVATSGWPSRFPTGIGRGLGICSPSHRTHGDTSKGRRDCHGRETWRHLGGVTVARDYALVGGHAGKGHQCHGSSHSQRTSAWRVQLGAGPSQPCQRCRPVPHLWTL